MSFFELAALAGFAMAAIAMLLVTQSKLRVSVPVWLIPAALAVPLIGFAGVTVFREGLFGFSALLSGSYWALYLWLDRLVSATAAFFLLQNRARAAGMKSEVWVLAVIVTGGLGLLLMLALTLYLERRARR